MQQLTAAADVVVTGSGGTAAAEAGSAPDPVLQGLNVLQHGQSAPMTAPQLGASASSGRAWRLWAAQHSQEEVGPLGAQLLPRVLELVASKAADFTAFDRRTLTRVSKVIV